MAYWCIIQKIVMGSCKPCTQNSTNTLESVWQFLVKFISTYCINPWFYSLVSAQENRCPPAEEQTTKVEHSQNGQILSTGKKWAVGAGGMWMSLQNIMLGQTPDTRAHRLSGSVCHIQAGAIALYGDWCQGAGATELGGGSCLEKKQEVPYYRWFRVYCNCWTFFVDLLYVDYLPIKKTRTLPAVSYSIPNIGIWLVSEDCHI